MTAQKEQRQRVVDPRCGARSWHGLERICVFTVPPRGLLSPDLDQPPRRRRDQPAGRVGRYAVDGPADRGVGHPRCDRQGGSSPSQSMSKKPARCSFASANGPSLIIVWFPATVTRLARAGSARCSLATSSPVLADARRSERIDLHLVPLDLRPAPHRRVMAHHAPTRLDAVLHGTARSARPPTLSPELPKTSWTFTGRPVWCQPAFTLAAGFAGPVYRRWPQLGEEGRCRAQPVG